MIALMFYWLTKTIWHWQGSCDTTPATPESLVGGCTSSSLVCSGEEDSGVAVRSVKKIAPPISEVKKIQRWPKKCPRLCDSTSWSKPLVTGELKRLWHILLPSLYSLSLFLHYSCGGASPGNNGNQSSQSATAPPSSAEANISTGKLDKESLAEIVWNLSEFSKLQRKYEWQICIQFKLDIKSWLIQLNLL